MKHLRVLALSTALMACGTSAEAAGECSYAPTVTPSFGSATSFAAQTGGLTTSSSAVASCTGALLNVLVILGTTPRLQATVGGSTNNYRLVNTNGSGDSIAYSISAAPNGQYPITPGTTFEYYQQTLLNLLGLLGGTGGNVPMHFATAAATNLSAGTYSDSFTITWDWKICNVGAVACLGYTTGHGVANVTLTLNVTNACEITSAPSLSFGLGPTPESFGEISKDIQVLCTKGLTTFTVGLDSGQHQSGGRRRMTNGTDALQYDLFRASNNALWGLNGTAVGNATTADGVTSERFSYRARIYTDQTTPPVGHYTDSVTINVAW